MKKSMIRIVCFLLILFIILQCVNHIFRFKYSDGIYTMTKFYELEDNTVDVLILGSSRAFENFNTGTLWDEYGMASYTYGSSLQPMWSTYYYLREALKTQEPELIVLEAGRLVTNYEYEGDEKIISGLYGMRWSLDKLKAIAVSVPTDRLGEFIPTNVRYHTRYTELSKADFYRDQGNPFYRDWKGFLCDMETMPFDSVWESSCFEERMPLYEKTEKYYRKTIELAQLRNIPIVVVISPYASISEEHEALFNTGADIAAEYGVEFIECNRLADEMGIDYTSDVADPSHLNYRGNRKFSRYIGGLLKSRYSISDRRGDPRYDSWQRSADFTARMIRDQELSEIGDSRLITEKLLDDDYLLFISVNGDCTADKPIEEFLAALGVHEEAAEGIWCRDNEAYPQTGFLWQSGAIYTSHYISIPSHDFRCERYQDEDGNDVSMVTVDRKEYRNTGTGVNVMVYDKVTESVADSFALRPGNEYGISR